MGDQRGRLEDFIRDADLPENVKQTAQMKIADPDLTFEVIAQLTGVKAPPTVWRRYKAFEASALEADFTVPPLPDLDAAVQLATTAAGTR